MIRFIQNIGDYFSTTYFDEDFPSKVLDKTGYARDQMGEFNKRISPLSLAYFRFKQQIIEGGLRTKDKIYETHIFHSLLLEALGYQSTPTNYNSLFHLNEHEALPIRNILYRGENVQLMIMEMQPMVREGENEPDSLFEQCYNIENEEQHSEAQRYHRKQWERVFTVPDGVKISPSKINEAVSALFLLKHNRPKYILLLAGNILFLLEQDKWDRGSYLKFDLEELFTEHQATPSRNIYALFYFLLSQESLAHQSNMVLLDQLDEDSHKSAYEVTKDLKEGIIHAVEALANEALYFKKQVAGEEFDETDDRFEQEMKDECLTLIYRLLFIFYAESRNELDILPTNDRAYVKGYSLEMLRDLEQVPLYADSSRNGYFFHDSLFTLFHLLGTGYREKVNGDNKSFRVRTIDSPQFDDNRLLHLKGVKFRNIVWQEIIRRLSLSKEQRGRNRGRISYANLGINQLGSAYESLLAYRGFYAEQDYIEVHKAGKPEEGTYLVPRTRWDDFNDDEILKDENGEAEILKKGAFVYRLSGRDRQKSASYYTPEVLTRCTVKYTLKPILERLDNKEIGALELLNLKLLEPAMGAAAFHNEMINQLAEAYLTYRQDELNQRIAPNKYREELQKVKAYIATHNVYGVDINPTAIELGKLSLWLNVIHKDMETPFFSNRLGIGNAVVGAWLKAYPADAFLVELDRYGQPERRQPTKEWWETAPRKLEIGKRGILRKEKEVYHFLLPDKNMLASANIAMLRAEHSEAANRVREWKHEWVKPILPSELKILQSISVTIDGLLKEYYQFQSAINRQTQTRLQVFGVPVEGVQTEIKTYHEKEALADYRNRHNAPYFKLKMVMDYWCALWFWDMRQAGELPNRQQYWQDIADILDLDLVKVAADTRISRKPGEFSTNYGPQLNIFKPVDVQLTLDSEMKKTVPAAEEETLAKYDANQAAEAESASFINEAFIRYSAHRDFFDQNHNRIKIVQELALKYRFFHHQLEFLDVFWERGGFDLIAGNPPWIKLQFEEKGIISEKFPEVTIRNVTAPQVRNMQAQFLSDERLKELYIEEVLSTECAAAFMNAVQNYFLLLGQQTNLYKCVQVNGFTLLGEFGFMGLLHPEGVYDDPNGQPLRKEMYQRLRFHFQFVNELMLFAEVDHHAKFSSNVYSGKIERVKFITLANLFHPSTIDGCFIHDGKGSPGGYKIKNESDGKMIWNLFPHSERLIRISENELKLLSKTFENSTEWMSSKLVNLHVIQLIRFFSLLSQIENKLANHNPKFSECWHETYSQTDKSIAKVTKNPDIEKNELILSGPQYFVSNPIYKNPREKCSLNSDYDVVDLTAIDESYITRTNFIPAENFYHEIDAEWIGTFRLAFPALIGSASERTLKVSIIPPKVSHIQSINSVLVENEITILLCGVASSIPYDFILKSLGIPKINNSFLNSIPLPFLGKLKLKLFNLTLQLNCLNKYYAPLWEDNFNPAYTQEQWSKTDERLKPFNTLTPQWQWSTPLRNWYERRQALVEIDVITAMALNLTLDELILIYNVQFPVLQQNEDDTWYDTKGNIVFTCSKGLTGVGVDRSVWEQKRNLPAGQTFKHTITKSELYNGKEMTYHAPFDKCDRVEDYKVAWEHFEKIFEP